MISSTIILWGALCVGFLILEGCTVAMVSLWFAIGAAAAIAISVGSFISGGSCTPDFVRFSKNAKIAVVTTVIAFFLGNSLMFFFGAVGTMTYQVNDISEVLFKQGLLLWAIIALGLNIWTTNDNAIYTSGLGFSNITGIPKRFTVLFNGLLGTLAALWLYNNFCGYLNILNVFLPPVGAVVIARDDVSEDDVYNFCAGVFDNIDAISAVHAKGLELNLDFATSVTSVPYHAGAAKYFAEQGITVPTK